MISLICLLRSATISFGVPAGTSTPTQPSPSMPGKPAAAMVGTSGIDDDGLLAEDRQHAQLAVSAPAAPPPYIEAKQIGV